MAKTTGQAADADNLAFPSIATGSGFDDVPAPPMPVIDPGDSDAASTAYSRYRTKLSTHRTGLSEHRTALSTQRTDMSTRRTDMSGRRTGMSFQRTRMSADRTLMSIIRTSLSMISFGFTIYQFFRGLESSNVLAGGQRAATFFGEALVWLGVGMLVVGIIYHVQFMVGLRREREAMRVGAYIHAESVFPVSLTLMVAILLLLLGLSAGAGIAFGLGPFG